MSSLAFDGSALVLKTPYSPGLVAELKAAIPACDRLFDAQTKAWKVAPEHGRLLVSLTERHLGERLTIPAQSQTLSKRETRLLEIKYIGTTKERGSSDERSAFGMVNGAWSTIFPEKVLREWFDAPARPDKEVNYYQILAVAKTADAQALKQAYRRLARQWHPDVCKEPGAAEVFKRIQAAYEVLSNESKRGRYDAGLALAASMANKDKLPWVEDMARSLGYRSPLRCGLILCEGLERLGRFVVSAILAWEDITNDRGEVLSVSWPMGADAPVEVWA